MRFQQLAGRLWRCPGNPDPATVQAVVAVERGSVLIDAGQSPAHAREIQAAPTAAGLPQPRWLDDTHHWYVSSHAEPMTREQARSAVGTA